MGQSHISATKVLTAAVATSGTFTVDYPSGYSKGNFSGGVNHYLMALQSKFTQPDKITLSFGATAVTVTYLGATTIPANSTVYFNFDAAGERSLGESGEPFDTINSYAPNKVTALVRAEIDLGSPLTRDDDALLLAATGTLEVGNANTVTHVMGGGASPVDGANTTGILDVPRNIIVKAAGTSLIQLDVLVKGRDVFNQTMSELVTIASVGTLTTVEGKKAFKRVDRFELTSARDVSGMTVNVGFADILGLPVHLPHRGHVTVELQDDATVSAGTIVAGLARNTASVTLTTSAVDVRGTYGPANAPDGSRGYKLIVDLKDVNFRGNPQA